MRIEPYVVDVEVQRAYKKLTYFFNDIAIVDLSNFATYGTILRTFCFKVFAT